MRSFLLKASVFAALQLGLLAGVYRAYLVRLPSSEDFMATSNDKHRLLRTQASPRLIFVGGSSVAMGIDSALVAGRCGFHPVNLGLHASLGLAFMLNEVEAGLLPGDVVVILPEFLHFGPTLWGNSQLLVHAIERRPANIAYLEPRQIKRMLDQTFLDRVGTIVRTALGPRDGAEDPESIYKRGSFNTAGDLVAHYELEPKEITQNQPLLGFPAHQVRKTIDRINAFVETCRRKGIRTFYSHPPIPRFAYEANQSEILRLESRLREELKCPLLDSCEEMVYPVGLFYDSIYHLNLRGVNQHSEFLAGRLRREGVARQ